MEIDIFQFVYSFMLDYGREISFAMIAVICLSMFIKIKGKSTWDKLF